MWLPAGEASHSSFGILCEFQFLPESMVTGGKLTMLSWPRVIASFDAIPEVYHGALKELLGDRRDLPYLVYAPRLARFLDTTSEKLICDLSALSSLEQHRWRVGGRTTKRPVQRIDRARE